MNSAPPLAAPPGSDPTSTTDGGFFRWVEGLGLARRDGWGGGVCAGVAARWGIDPVIVRGIAVVATIIGLPAVVAYALAWAVLPDASGRTHAADLERGRFTYTQGAILAVAIVGAVQILGLLITLAGLATSSSAGAVTAVLVALALMGGAVLAAAVIALLVRAARRTPGTDEDELRRASAASETVPAASADGSVADAGAGGTEGDAVAPVPPVPLSNDAGPADLAAWRAQHAAWKERDRAWRREQDDADRAARAAAREERRATAAAFAREAAERRRARRAERPRTSIAFVAVSAGVAVIAGTVAGLAAPGSLSVALGLFIAALVTALAMIVAGATRRRSGFLAFTSVCLLMGGGSAIALTVVAELHIGAYAISNVSSDAATAPFRQTFGDLHVTLVDAPDAHSVSIEKGAGTTLVTVDPGVEVVLRASVGDDASFVLSHDDEWTLLADGPDARSDGPDRTAIETTIASIGPTTTQQVLTVDQESGYIEIRLLGTKRTHE